MKKSTLLKKLGGFVKVQNVQTNQIVINFENGKVFQSYESIIAIKLNNNDALYLGDDYNYSMTTSKYLNKVFGFTSKECTNKIKEGVFKLIK